MTPRLKEKYRKQVIPALKEEFGYANPHQIPKVEKIVLNMGIGRGASDQKYLDQGTEILAKIAGQVPVTTVARHSIAGFKLREGQKVGAKVTLRGDRMYEFLDRLIAVTLPRVRDFRGLNRKAVDREGNYSIGVVDHTIFPEAAQDEIGISLGLQVNIVTSARDRSSGLRLLELLGLPIRREVG